MIYKYFCPLCEIEEDVNKSIDERDNFPVCYKCGFKMKRLISSPGISRVLGLQNASKRDGVGYYVDEQGNVCEPLTRGHKDKKVL